ncbi:TPA: hypothetical protein N0F65_002927 [Lagenidium giganteum]|uniref:tetraacyldisaccharide 4'-kinase n=1 Tax=Lagenidium giganteum TaxID=4803 RepID=A0AAV2Z3A3_9STRA|nr:TPA: hypothetical protein N0F65_002927 [Lagenidium giganteum]
MSGSLRDWHRQWHQRVLRYLRSPLAPANASDITTYVQPQPWLSRVYALLMGHKRRRHRRAAAWLGPRSVPTISVGNVTFGATGKTPFVEYLVRLVHPLSERAPVLLTRGYGDDEWRMVTAKFPSARLVKGADRFRLGSAYVQQHRQELSCVILDDGLQQWQIRKDLEIVMVDALHPFGNGKLLPCGSLREAPQDALQRADIVVVHHFDLVACPQRQAALLQTVDQLTRRPIADGQASAIVATSRMRVKALVPLTTIQEDAARDYGSGGCELRAHLLDGAVALVVCGVGNPESVLQVVRRLPHAWTDVAIEAFPDHHAFTHEDVLDVVARVHVLAASNQQSQVVVLTTEKDAARSKEILSQVLGARDIPVFVLESELQLLLNRHQVEERVRLLLERS